MICELLSLWWKLLFGYGRGYGYDDRNDGSSCGDLCGNGNISDNGFIGNIVTESKRKNKSFGCMGFKVSV